MFRLARGKLVFATLVVLAGGCSGGGATAPGSPATQPSGAAAAVSTQPGATAPATATPTSAPTPLPTATPTAAASVGTLAIDAVEPGSGSATIDIAPFPGAADYRAYDIANPARIVYAGVAPNRARGARAVPATRIVWDGLAGSGTTTLVVEAVDALGPFPPRNLASGVPLSAACLGTPQTAVPPRAGASEGGVGTTSLARGGLGCPSSVPNVIARSTPFRIGASGLLPLPSSAQARGVALAPFDSRSGARLVAIVPPNPAYGTETLTLGAAPNSWTVLVDGADMANTSLALVDGTFDDVLFDGATPGIPAPPHAGRAAVALVPNVDADLTGGAILHATFAANAHGDAHRVVGIDVAPANAPLASFYPDDASAGANAAVFVEIASPDDGGITVDQLVASHVAGAPAEPNGRVRLVGPATSGARARALSGDDGGPNGRERFDLFLTQNRFALFENGVLASDGAFAVPLPFADAKVYFVHALSHSADDLAALRASGTDDAWVRFTPYSDERRWSDVGIETLPPSTSWASLDAAIRLPEREVPRR